MSTIVETTPAPVIVKDELTLNREAALAWVQEHGYEGQELPKGKRWLPRGCVIAQALGGKVTGYQNRLWYPASGAFIALPRRVSDFTHNFDRGLHPDLIAE